MTYMTSYSQDNQFAMISCSILCVFDSPRKDGKYILTLFGKVIHEVQLILLELVRSHWQPEAVDSLSSMKENTRKECKQVFVDHLIENAGMVPMTSTIVSSEVVK
jgi:hypothetical protein